MKHYYARQDLADGRWEFVVNDNGLIYPVGYCVGTDLKDPEFIKALGGQGSVAYKYYASKMTPFAHLFHANGHDTKEEACACYRRYLLDHLTNLKVSLSTDRDCIICGCRTRYMAQVQGLSYVLCDDHRNRDELSGLLPVLLELFV